MKPIFYTNVPPMAGWRFPKRGIGWLRIAVIINTIWTGVLTYQLARLHGLVQDLGYSLVFYATVLEEIARKVVVF